MSFPELQQRIPPHNLEAEQSILASILVFPEVYDDISGIVISEDFYRPEHQIIFKAISESGTNTDIVSLVTLLKKKNELDKVGGPAYISNLSDQIPSKSQAKGHAKLVKEASKLRSFIATGSELIASCYEGGSFDHLTGQLESEVMKLSEKNNRGSEAKPLIEVIQKSFKHIEMISSGQIGSGIQTGFMDVDHIMIGMQPSDLIVLAGRPSMGKTALAMSIVKRVGFNQIPAGVFSLEMSDIQLGNRMLSDESRINSIILKSGHMMDGHWPKLTQAYGAMSDLPIYIDDTPALHINELRSRARIMKRKHDIQIIFIDYLQLMKGPGENREREISNISGSLKAMAKELNIPVIALSQLNRSLESRTDKRPMLSDLRESGAIEQDADVVMFIYRDEVYKRDSAEKGVAEVIIGKQRNGPTGFAKIQWNQQTTSFNDLAR